MKIVISEKDKSLLAVDSNCDFYLKQILGYEFWGLSEAINYCLGIAKINWYESNESENVAMTLSGTELTEAEYPDLFSYLQLETERFHEIWAHSKFGDENSPEFFIKWAENNSVDIPWLEYYKAELLSGEGKEHNELHPRERTSLLNLIAALRHLMLEGKFERGDFQWDKDGKTTCFKSQSALIDMLIKDYQGYDGISRSKISAIFAECNKF
jgi:hypothetical protein